MTKPFQIVLGLIPKGVMAGLFVSQPLATLMAVVHGNRRAVIVRRNRPDALPHQGPDQDLAH
jgi:hypothetical protein